MIGLLEEHGLCPFTGAHALQVTVGNISVTKSSYYVLMLLELLYSSEERMLDGRGNAAWAKKGRSGVFAKKSEDLMFGSSTAVELKTLELPKNVKEFYQLLIHVSLLARFLKIEHDGGTCIEWEVAKAELGGLLVKNGVSNTLWRNPKDDNNLILGQFVSKMREMRPVARMIMAKLEKGSY
jgi:hypothetical protein